MFRTFSLGLVLGLLCSAALLWLVPPTQLEREPSIIDVVPNGGNREVFHANLPDDRVLAGSTGGEPSHPDAVNWPRYLDVRSSRTELFKLRNSEDRVIGIASRIAEAGPGGFVEWAVHLPARGTLYLVLDGGEAQSGSRGGRLRAGSREFVERTGRVIERFVPAVEGAAGTGRLELVTSMVSLRPPDEDLVLNDDGSGSGGTSR